MDETFSALRRFVRPREAVEQCDLCSVGLPPEHSHLFEPLTRHIQCACEACSILFSNRGDGRFLRVPRDATYLADFQISDEEWNGLQLPIQLAFLFWNSMGNRVVAMYPSPAGATESLLSLDAWSDIVDDNPVLKNMQPDIEALLINRVGDKREYYIAPIDECYKLVGLIRMNWRGLSGGTEVWREINRFFDELRSRSTNRKEVTIA